MEFFSSDERMGGHLFCFVFDIYLNFLYYAGGKGWSHSVKKRVKNMEETEKTWKTETCLFFEKNLLTPTTKFHPLLYRPFFIGQIIEFSFSIRPIVCGILLAEPAEMTNIRTCRHTLPIT